MIPSIFGISAPKFIFDSTTVLLDYVIILNDEPDYKEIVHESIINRHREFKDLTDHWVYEIEIQLFNYPENERLDKFTELDSYDGEIVELYRRRDGQATGLFRLDEIHPIYLERHDYPDKIYMRFISTTLYSGAIIGEIEFIGSIQGYQETTVQWSGAMPVHQTGDLIVICISRNGTTSPPTLSDGSYSILTGDVVGNITGRIFYKIAESDSEVAPGTNTDCLLTLCIYRNAIVGEFATLKSISKSIAYPQLISMNTNGLSWILTCQITRAGTNVGIGQPTDFATREFISALVHISPAQNSLGCFDSNIGLDEWLGESIIVIDVDVEQIGFSVELLRNI